MTQINLLPWREQVRYERKIHFFIMLALFIALAVLIDIFFYGIVSTQIKHQQRTNAFLQSQLNQEQATIVTLTKKKQEANQIYSRLQYIYSLKNTSYKAIKILNALINTLPPGIIFTKVSREGDNITLIGKANSNSQITLLMDNISKLVDFKQPVLTEITGKENEGADVKMFQIKLIQQG